ncbi:MAG: FHA domain-containing protein [Chloroflexota bacterium]|nr:FHA domain-containing protein [Chloroflexia bacterium]MDQ3167108.1 FHA domain-containing protein [Chloroflexota bacterium]MDQ3512888.1 FHA domain-containing protein [Chloroflexota bacterium]
MSMNLPADWFLLLLRLLFAFLLLFFLYQLFRVQVRELVALAVPAPAQAPVERRRDRQATLIVTDGARSDLIPGTTFVVIDRATVGRRADADVHLDDASTSADHAELRYANQDWWVADAGSTNGTLVNDRSITAPTRIRDGDVVQFGRIRMEFTVGR